MQKQRLSLLHNLCLLLVVLILVTAAALRFYGMATEAQGD